MTSVYRRILLVGAASLALGAQAAHAQTAPQAGAADNAVTDEIVVTAQFRSQKLQDTPLAITALSGATIAARGQGTVTDVAASAPSVNIEKSATGGGVSPQLTIRGIGQTDFFPSVEPGVGVYIDDVYYGVMVGSTFDLLDLDRVEILRGPQGTLSGKNSVGGSIKLFSQQPNDTLGGFVELGYGRYNKIEGRGSVNVPITDKVQLRVSGLVRNQDGYVKRLDYGCVHPGTLTPLSGSGVSNCVLGRSGGENVSALRGILTINWSPELKQTITADTIRDKVGSQPAVLLLQPPGSPQYNFVTAPDSFTNYNTFTGNTFTTKQFNYRDEDTANQWGVSNIFDLDVAGLKVKSITAFRRTKAGMTQMGSLSPIDTTSYTQQYDISYRQFTQELRVSGKVGEVADWTVGGFYLTNKNNFNGRINLSAFGIDFLQLDTIPSHTTAGFAQLSLHPTPKLNITGGVRYTHETKTYQFGRGAPNGGAIDPTQLGLDGLVGRYSGGNWDFRIAADYRWNEQLMTYAQYSTGFKGGGVNSRTFFASQVVPFTPEKVKSVEVGFKADLLDRHLRLNGAGYYTKYTDMQLLITSCDAISYIVLPNGVKFFIPNAPCNATQNAGNAKIWGAEFEASAEPIEGLTLNASASFTGFKYLNVNAATGIPLGAELPYLSKTKFSAGAQYEFKAFKGTVTPRLDYDYRSGFLTESVPSANPYLDRVNSRGIFNAHITYQTADKAWQVTGNVSNLFDTFYLANKFNVPAFGLAQAVPGRPREWSISLKRSF